MNLPEPITYWGLKILAEEGKVLDIKNCQKRKKYGEGRRHIIFRILNPAIFLALHYLLHEADN